MKRKVVAILVTKMFFFSILCGSAFGGLTPPPPQQDKNSSNSSINSNNKIETKIIKPKNGATVTNETIVTGSDTNTHDNDLWVFVWPEKARNVGWPQSDSAAHGISAFKKKEEWSVRCYFGGPPQFYEIAVYSATKSASKILSNLLKGWYKNNNYPGIHLSRLPDGLVEKDRIKVIKK